MNILIKNLPHQISAGDLNVLFKVYGRVRSVRLIKDRFKDRSKGFGVVNMMLRDNGLEAIRNLNGKTYFKSVLRVNAII